MSPQATWTSSWAKVARSTTSRTPGRLRQSRQIRAIARTPSTASTSACDSAPALADLDGDGTLRPRPSIDKLRYHVFTDRQRDLRTSRCGESMARSTTSRTPGRLRRRCSCKGPEARTPSTASTSRGAPPRSRDHDGTLDRVRRSINCRTSFLAGFGSSSWAMALPTLH